MDYMDFLENKTKLSGNYGFEPLFMPDCLFDFQRAIVEWATLKGKAAIFADCGMGKSIMQLVWGENVFRKTKKPVLLLTPLAVSIQMQLEAEKFGINAKRSHHGEIESDIVITNYERLHHFKPESFSGVILDESSILKNFKGHIKHDITIFMRKIPYRLLATATAAPNDFIELGTSSEALGYLGYIDMLGYPFCRGRLFTTMEKDYHQYDDIAEVFWASGACMFVRKQIYHQLNGLDDDFFTHMEEIDFCWRVKSANYKVMCFPKSVVYHYGGGTLAMGSPKKTFYNFRNNLIMLYKNLPTNQLFRVFTLRFFLDVVAACRFLFDTGVKDFVAVFKAYVDFIWTIKKTHQKRKQITHQTKDLTKIYKRIIIIQYFLLKKTKFSDLNKEDFM